MKRRYGVSLVLVLMLVGFAAASETEKADVGKKGFWVEKSHLELKPVAAGADAVATYVFHNDTAKPVKIIRAKPS